MPYSNSAVTTPELENGQSNTCNVFGMYISVSESHP